MGTIHLEMMKAEAAHQKQVQKLKLREQEYDTESAEIRLQMVKRFEQNADPSVFPVLKTTKN